MSDLRSIFISHTHDDGPLADAVSGALYDLVGREQIRVDYSTNKDYDGGIKPGADWYRWIHNRVSDCSAAIIILTSTSVRKPWVLYESGAVAASAYNIEDDIHKLRPMIFQMSEDSVPSPLKHVQTVRGDDAKGARHLFRQLADELGSSLAFRDALRIGERMDGVITRYMEKVREALRISPLEPSEGIVQEWCKRLDEAASEYRAAAVQHLHNCINVAFGVSHADGRRPLDVRIHRRLGDMFLDVEMYEDAATQYEFARQLAPRDLFILRAQGQALLGLGEIDRVRRVIDDIANFDSDAFVQSADCAALLARVITAEGDLQEAERVLRRALAANDKNYYIADLVGQNLISRGDLKEARAVYAKVLTIMTETRESNIWYLATRATAQLVADDEAAALDDLREIRPLRPSPSAIQSVQSGLRRVADAFGFGDGPYTRWINVMRG